MMSAASGEEAVRNWEFHCESGSWYPLNLRLSSLMRVAASWPLILVMAEAVALFSRAAEYICQ